MAKLAQFSSTELHFVARLIGRRLVRAFGKRFPNTTC